MSNLCCLPGLFCGIAVALSDLASRRVPRLWIVVGLCSQLAVFAFDGARRADPWALAAAVSGAALAGALQLLLAFVRPGALGLGDVTASALIGCCVGRHGVEAFLIWWTAMGLLGPVWLLHGTHGRRGRAHDARVPFVPVIVVAGALALATVKA